MSFGVSGIENSMLKTQYLGIETDDTTYLVNETNFNKILVNIDEASTTFTDIQSASDIKDTAPSSYKSGDKLISILDFEQYVLQNYANAVYDVTGMNNFKYLSTFIKWLYEYDKLTPSIRILGYALADACDFNNIYLFVKNKTNSYNISNFVKSQIDKDMLDKKCGTAETMFLDPVTTYFFPHIGSDIPDFTALDTTIEIIKDPSSLVSKEKIKAQANTIVTSFFALTNNTIGTNIDLVDLKNQLRSIPGVANIYTVNGTTRLSGLYFAKWTPQLINGLDFEVSNSDIQLEEFQFPVLKEQTKILNQITIIDGQISNIGTEY
jgi:hypothetical protein